MYASYCRPPRFSDPAKKAEERLKAQEEFQKETQAQIEQIPCLEEDEEAGELDMKVAEDCWDKVIEDWALTQHEVVYYVPGSTVSSHFTLQHLR